jgi:small multidrug resistance pump
MLETNLSQRPAIAKLTSCENRGELQMNPWFLLAIAIVFEIAGTSLLKASNGFARPGVAIAAVAAYAICFWPLALAITRIPVGVAYAIWSAVGIVAIAAIGWIVYRQALSAMQLAFMLMIVVGVVGLNLVTPTDTRAPSPQNSA